MSIRPVELEDVQGLVRHGYRKMAESSFLLLRVKDPDAARAWLAVAPVSSAMEQKRAPTTALQIAFTSEGLQALGLPKDVIEGFSSEFLVGMSSDESRARRLGDIGPNDPAGWRWGGSPDRIPHVLLMLYAELGGLEAWQRSVLAQCQQGFEPMEGPPPPAIREDSEPFGFTDGLSQPSLDWDRERAVRDEERTDYSNVSCLGEYLLGYPNEYGAYTDRPLLDPEQDPDEMLARAEDAPGKADFGLNGSYLVMRQLQQHVGRFWRFVDAEVGGDPELREQLAATMVGRTTGGEPLVGRTNEQIPGVKDADNSFTYASDPEGLRCPIGAHIRRSNPRNADLPGGPQGWISWARRTLGWDAQALAADHVSSTRFHRLLRRGRAYGGRMSIEEALASPAGEADVAGLHFICLGANIARQFEFVQSAWLSGLRFDGLSDESDPLIGHHLPRDDGTPTDGFSIPLDSGPDRRVCGLQQFVTVRGGAYFFLPSLRALRYLSKGP